MRIKEDYSYLSETEKKAIAEGLAKLYIYSIRLDRFFTEEEQAENARQAQALTREQWAQRCDKIAQEIGAQNTEAMTALLKHFEIGQYSADFSGDGDFWFWCNCNNGRKLDYITLTTQGATAEEKNAKAEKARAVLETVNTKNNIAYLQYATELDQIKLDKIAEEYTEKTAGAFVKYAGMIGKIKRIDESTNNGKKWAFMKKGAKTRGYYLTAWNIYEIKTENE
jgi:hypothetical protein